MGHGHALRGFGFRAMSRGRRGPGPWGGAHWGMGPEGFGPPFGRRPRMRRGDVRAALLVLLDEEPRNGYALMQEIEQRSEGLWKPSPGSVYPALQQLEDEGLAAVTEAAGRKAYELTDEGRAYVEEHRDALAAPWDDVAGEMGSGVSELRSLASQVTAALMQVAFAGSEAQVEEAKKVLAETRRALYRILAEDDPDDGPAGGAADDDGPAA